MATRQAGLVLQRLSPDEASSLRLYAVLDGARDPRIVDRIRLSGLPHECLFAGQLTSALRNAAPHLVQLDLDHAFTRFLVEEGWGQSWGIYLWSHANLEIIRRHLRTLLRVRGEQRWLLFRYYDPRVLRSFLPTCDTEQIGKMFGPIAQFDMEGPLGEQFLRFAATPPRGIVGPSLRSHVWRLVEHRAG